MLWVVFNKDGQLVYQINDGEIPAAGTTSYQIFAIFQELSLVNYNSASIELYKPDLLNNSYYPLMMTKKSEEYNGPENAFLTVGQSYLGFIFNFFDYDGENDTVSLLDTSGMWRAVVTLYDNYDATSRMVVGSVEFYVGNGIESDDNITININTLLTHIYAKLATKLDVFPAGEPSYVKVIATNDIYSYDFSQGWLAEDVIFNKVNNTFYKLNQLKIPEQIWPVVGEDKLQKVLNKYLSDYPTAEEIAELRSGEFLLNIKDSKRLFWPGTEDGNFGLFSLSYSNQSENVNGYYINASALATTKTFGEVIEAVPIVSQTVDVELDNWDEYSFE